MEAIVASAKTGTLDFSKTATTDEGVFKVADGMYGDYSYYWRGAVTNNYVKFANFCWRIIRINGDGSIRLIYDGTTCNVNGQSTAESIAVANQVYNSSDDRSEYVGYTYAEGSQRPSDNMTGTVSNLKTQTDNWYKTNITDKGYDGKVAIGKFCNNRKVSGTWTSQPSSDLYYEGYYTSGLMFDIAYPTLSCSTNDIYSLKAGAITMDEAIMAGSGKYGSYNSSYYLYNGQNYWTMTPFYHFLAGNSVGMIYIKGVNIHAAYVTNSSTGIRPVINLRSDVQFKLGTDGTLNNPYEVL